MWGFGFGCVLRGRELGGMVCWRRWGLRNGSVLELGFSSVENSEMVGEMALGSFSEEGWLAAPPIVVGGSPKGLE